MISKTIKIFDVILILFFFLLFPSSQKAQPVQATATLDTLEMLIGDQVRLHIRAEYAPGNRISWPLIGDTLTGQIEVVEKKALDTLRRQESEILSQTLTITSFDTGYLVIPPFRFVINDDSALIEETEPLLLLVKPIAVDTTLAIKDIKAPLEVPFTFAEAVPYLLAVLGLIALIILVIILYKKYFAKKKKTPFIMRKPKLPPHRIAFEKLYALEQKKLWQQGKFKPYYTELTEILRMYIEQRFRILAMELTTDEILAGIRFTGISGEATALLKHILITADLVKFAKIIPPASENKNTMKDAFEFVKMTKEGAEVSEEKTIIEQ